MNIPRSEYPRPQFERAEWINLNGTWSCAFDWSRSGEAKDWKNASSFENQITVPYCPESKLSGIGMTDFIEMMWYQRKIDIPSEWQDKQILLNFGGVDYKCIVYIDGTEAGNHTGGVSPFSVDITSLVTPGHSHNLVVQVEDELRSGLQPFGKQSPTFKSRMCNYTRTTGIWQTVWLEAVDRYGLKSCRITPDYDNGSFAFMPVFYNNKCGMQLEITLRDGDRVAASRKVAAGSSCVVSLAVADPHAWTPADPFLYDVEFTLFDNEDRVIDKVISYAGLRKIHLENGRYYLNNEPIFLRFVLDQGFYEDGLWTAPSDEALKKDIELSMKAGFNGARLHQKIFDERFHFWADHLGYLTWAEFPDWGISFWQHFGKTNPDYMRSFRDYFAEWSTVVERDVNHPSIIAWTPFNETRGFLDLAEHRRIQSDIYDLTRRLDPARPVNDASGYVHAKTDLWTVHLYAQQTETLNERVNTEPVYMYDPEIETPAWNGQPYIVDEYGGVSFIPEDRDPFADNSWGYNKDKLTREETEQRITDLTAVLVNNPRVAGYCYTQLTDIEQEQNGIYNYDRTAKFDEKTIFKCFSMKPEWSRY